MACGIYKFENKINNQIYIGQSTDLEDRYKKHLNNIYDNNHQEDLYKAFRKYGINNFSYEILIELEEIDLDKLNQLECYYIDFYDSIKPNGYNMVPGGSNGAGLAKGKKVQQFDLMGNFIQEFDSARQAGQAVGINYSSICSCCRGEISHTKEFQWRYSESDKIITSLNNVIINDKKIYQYDLNGMLINTYVSLKEASELSNVSKPIISKVCRGQGKSAGGYYWSYEKYEKFPVEKRSGKLCRKIAQYDLNNNLIAIFDTAKEASTATGTNTSNIYEVCNGKRKTANKFKWKYVN